MLFCVVLLAMLYWCYVFSSAFLWCTLSNAFLCNVLAFGHFNRATFCYEFFVEVLNRAAFC